MPINKRLGTLAALVALTAVGIAALPSHAQAWWAWRGGVRVWIPGPAYAYVPPPVVYYAPPRPYYVAPPIIYGAPPPVVVVPQRVWIPAHWRGPYWIPGHWA